MTALLRSDAYRVLHGRWIWVVVAIVTFLTLAPALLMRWTHMGPVAFDNLTGSALSLGGCEILVSVMAAIVCCDRTDLGFGRSLLSSLSPRACRVWFAEKCIFSVLLAGVTLLFALALGLLALPITGVPILAPEPAWQVAAWFGCNWLVGSTYAALTVLVAHLTRNETVTVGFAVLVSTGILEGGIVIGIDALCYLAGGRLLDFSSAVAPWLPAQAVSAIGESAGALLAPDNVTGLAPVVRALIVCLPLTVAVTVADALLVSRRDVA